MEHLAVLGPGDALLSAQGADDSARLAAERLCIMHPLGRTQDSSEPVDHLGAVLVPMGSVGTKGTSVTSSEVAICIHAGGQCDWNSAAPVAVARGLGLHTSRIDGSPLRYNQPDPRLPDLLIANPEVVERVLTAIASIDSPFHMMEEN